MENLPLNVLILGKDKDFFSHKGDLNIGDTRARHIVYAEQLLKKRPKSKISVITYTEYDNKCEFDHPAEGLCLYGTSSYTRAFYLIDLIRLLPRVFSGGWRPNIVTVQTPWEEGVLGFFLARFVGAKFIPQLHFDLFSPDWLKEHWMNRVRKLVAIFIMRRADFIRVVSSPLKEKLVKVYGVDPNKIKVAPVGVNFTPCFGSGDLFKKKISSELNGHKLILFVGRLCTAKNLELWLRVARSVSHKRSDVAFLIVGGGDQYPKLLKLARDLGIENRVYFTGAVKHEDLPEIYAAADVFLLTSFYEGFGRVVLESMLSKVPVVSTQCTGPEDLIEDGVTGFILDSYDESKLANVVLDILNQPCKGSKVAENAFNMVQRKFEMYTLANRVIEVWES